MTRTLVRSPDGNRRIGERGVEPRPPGPKPGVRASYTTPQQAPEGYPRRRLPVRVRVLRIVLRRPHLVAVAVLGHRPVVLRDPLAVREGRRASGVLGAVDELGLGDLEALRLPTAGLLDRPARRVVAHPRSGRIVVVAGDLPGLTADVGRLARGGLFLAAFEFAVAFHARFLPHGTPESNRR